jgi:hypothetical protein
MRACIKENIEKVIEERRKLADNKVFQKNNMTLLSGECDFSFKFKLRGINNLYQIL